MNNHQSTALSKKLNPLNNDFIKRFFINVRKFLTHISNSTFTRTQIRITLGHEPSMVFIIKVTIVVNRKPLKTHQFIQPFI